ncbi:MAG: ECF-type sigma factor [bacterium]
MTEDETSPDEPGLSREMLPLVYDELRRLAARRMSRLPPGNTLQPTALVHEAYLRLARSDQESPRWNSRGHFVAAAVTAMHQILVDQVRRKKSLKRGGDRVRVEIDAAEIPISMPSVDLIDFHDALERLRLRDERKARIVLLRVFGGLDRQEVADVLEISRRTVDREWRYLVAWFHRELADEPAAGSDPESPA